MKNIILLLALLPSCLLVAKERGDWQPSPWMHNQAEIQQAVTLPITYPTTFTRERELFGYQPTFLAGTISFDVDNLPVMRAAQFAEKGAHATPYPSRGFYPNSYIQRLNKEGKWLVSRAHIEAIRDHLKLNANDPILLQAGNRVMDRVVIDAAGDAYTVVVAKTPKGGREFLLYSSDNLISWQVLEPFGLRNLRLENYATHNDIARNKLATPAIIASSKNAIHYLNATKEAGKLRLSQPILVAEHNNMVTASTMAGAGNHVITRDNISYLTYMDKTPVEGYAGTPQYLVTINKAQLTAQPAQFVGDSGDRVDGHNSSVLLVDSVGRLHLLLGTHWHSMVHLVAKTAGSTDFAPPLYVGGNGDNSWSRNGITYPGFTIDKEDNLHLVVRGRQSKWVKQDVANVRQKAGYQAVLDYALVYFKKPANGSWQTRRDLAIPHHMPYSNWYHKIGIDRLGNPYLSYSYYAHNLAEQDKQDYIKKWGGNGDKKSMLAHDLVLIHSADRGESWRISTSDAMAAQAIK